MGVDSPDRLRQILEILSKSRMHRGTVFNMVVLRGEMIQPSISECNRYRISIFHRRIELTVGHPSSATIGPDQVT
jgi:hypothetical protein